MIAYQLMAHPSRMEHVPKLEKTLKAGVTWDEKGDRWDTGRRAWMALLDSGAEYGCVIQDDAILCEGFTRVLPRALKHAPETAVVLYAGTSIRSEVRHVKDASWLVRKQINWGPGVVLPTRMIEEVLVMGDRYRIGNYDLRLSKWFERRGVGVWYTWPSLVNHRNGPSLVAGRQAGRHAYWFANQPELVDWSLPPVMLAKFRRST